MSDQYDDQLVADYLRRLTLAASALPADRRAELIEEITIHIAEARAAPGRPATVPEILAQLGDPAQIVEAAVEPAFSELAAGPRLGAGPATLVPVRIAVRLMYLGAAASLLKVIVDVATEHATRSAMLTALQAGARKSGLHTTMSQLNSGVTGALAMAFVLGLIGVGLWLLVARASSRGKDWARATASVLFGLYTLAVLIGPPDVGIRGPEAAVTRIFAGIIWLIGLAVIVFLWQRDSNAFYRAPRSQYFA